MSKLRVQPRGRLCEKTELDFGFFFARLFEDSISQKAEDTSCNVIFNENFGFVIFGAVKTAFAISKTVILGAQMVSSNPTHFPTPKTDTPNGGSDYWGTRGTGERQKQH